MKIYSLKEQYCYIYSTLFYRMPVWRIRSVLEPNLFYIYFFRYTIRKVSGLPEDLQRQRATSACRWFHMKAQTRS